MKTIKTFAVVAVALCCLMPAGCSAPVHVEGTEPDCGSELQLMQTGLATAQVVALLLVQSPAQAAAVNLAIEAAIGALSAAEDACLAGGDGWAQALATFDGALSRLAAASQLGLDAMAATHDADAPPWPETLLSMSDTLRARVVTGP